MAQSASRARRSRLFWTLLALQLLMIGTMMVSTAQTSAQTAEGAARLIPPISSVAADGGPFTVYIILEDVEHVGAISYDDNRDTVPDRQVESIGVAAFEITVAYDEAVVALESVEPGPALGRSDRAFQCLPPQEEPGSFRFGCISTGSEPTGLQGTLTLVSLGLRPLSPGSSPLLLETRLSGPLGDPVAVTVNGGAVRVTGKPAATATLTSQVSAPTSPEPSVQLSDTPSTIRTMEPRAPTGEAATAVATATPATSSGGTPTELVVADPSDTDAPDGRSIDEGGSSSPGVLLWTAVALGGLTGIGAFALAAELLRRRRSS